MKKEYFLQVIILLIAISTRSQEIFYFNNIYNHLNGITTGTSIIEVDSGYAGYGATINNSSNYQQLVLIKVGFSGEELIWKQYGNVNQAYYPGNIGGALIKTSDNNLALSYTTETTESVYSSLIKLNYNLA